MVNLTECMNIPSLWSKPGFELVDNVGFLDPNTLEKVCSAPHLIQMVDLLVKIPFANISDVFSNKYGEVKEVLHRFTVSEDFFSDSTGKDSRAFTKKNSRAFTKKNSWVFNWEIFNADNKESSQTTKLSDNNFIQNWWNRIYSLSCLAVEQGFPFGSKEALSSCGSSKVLFRNRELPSDVRNTIKQCFEKKNIEKVEKLSNYQSVLYKTPKGLFSSDFRAKYPYAFVESMNGFDWNGPLNRQAFLDFNMNIAVGHMHPVLGILFGLPIKTAIDLKNNLQIQPEKSDRLGWRSEGCLMDLSAIESLEARAELFAQIKSDSLLTYLLKNFRDFKFSAFKKDYGDFEIKKHKVVFNISSDGKITADWIAEGHFDDKNKKEPLIFKLACEKFPSVNAWSTTSCNMFVDVARRYSSKWKLFDKHEFSVDCDVGVNNPHAVKSVCHSYYSLIQRSLKDNCLLVDHNSAAQTRTIEWYKKVHKWSYLTTPSTLIEIPAMVLEVIKNIVDHFTCYEFTPFKASRNEAWGNENETTENHLHILETVFRK